MAKPIVAIVGRPNVGKSTLFNRIIGQRMAIVEDTPGVTRDRLYMDAEWNDRQFSLVDTGGIEFGQDFHDFIDAVRAQAQIAIDEADAIIFLVDGQTGLTPSDLEVAKILRRTKKPVLLAVNKIEKYDNLISKIAEFYELGFSEPIPVSSIEGMNTGDLMDMVVEMLPEVQEDDPEDDILRIAVIGRPNVGKSSLINKMLGEDRVIVSDIAGTTRDAIDSQLQVNGKKYLLIDTAGIRRKTKVEYNTERYSVIRSYRAVDRADLVIMMIDAQSGVTDQDKRIVGYAHEQGKGCIIAVNKWDLIDKDSKTADRFMEDIRDDLSFLPYAPIVFISAMTGQRVNRILTLADYVSEQQNIRIPTSDLNELVHDAVMRTPPPSDKGKPMKIFYATQSGVRPPTFVLFVNKPEMMHFSYLRYLENRLRETYKFEGTPLRFVLKKRTREQEE